jgi:hypothetical protein
MTESVEVDGGTTASHAEITVSRGGELSSDTGQSTAASRRSGVDSKLTPATRIWFGRVHNEPGTLGHVPSSGV